MRKFSLTIAALLIIIASPFILTACSKPAPAPREIDLTAANYKDYLIVSYNLEHSSTEVFGSQVLITDILKIDVSRKVACNFKNAELVITWGNAANPTTEVRNWFNGEKSSTISISYDGTGATTIISNTQFLISAMPPEGTILVTSDFDAFFTFAPSGKVIV